MPWLYAILIGLTVGGAIGYAAEHVPIWPVLQSVGAAFLAMLAGAFLAGMLPVTPPTGSGGVGAVAVGISVPIFVAPFVLAAVIHVLLGQLASVAPPLAHHRPVVVGCVAGLSGALSIVWVIVSAMRAVN